MVHIVERGFKEGLVSFGQSFANGAKWLGRKVSDGAVKFSEGVKSLWLKVLPHIKNGSNSVLAFLRTPVGLFGAGLLLGCTLVGISSQIDNKAANIALKVAAAVVFIGAGAALGMGIVSGFGVALI